MAYDPLNDPEFDAIKSRIDAAGEEDTTEQLIADIGARREATEHPVRRFVTNLPKNIGIASWKALVNTVDTISDVAAEANPQAVAAKAVGGEELRKIASPSLSEQYPEVMDSLRNFTSQWERNDTLSDDITQGVAQFALPFMGWLKLAGGLSGMSKAAAAGKALAVEGATAGSAFDPHEGRVADLIDLGMESETRFGTLLRQVAPDESLINRYVDYMTNRTDEGVAEGRWKNAVDAVVSSAAIGGLLKGAAGAYKFGKFALEDAGISGGPGAKYQKGMVAFHGTPYDFDAFDLSKIGTGEGAQSYGHGLYFAEDQKIAQTYREKLTRPQFLKGSRAEGAFKIGAAEMKAAGGDKQKAYLALTKLAGSPEGAPMREQLMDAARMVKDGMLDTKGKLVTVEIPDAAAAKMLDYDAPMSKQPNILLKIPDADRAKLSAMLEDYGQPPELEDYTGNELQQLIGRAIDEDYIAFDPRDGVFDGNRRKYAADYFLKHDIPGVRYLDGGSRKAGEGTRNLVLFDDSLVKILKKE